MNTLGKLLNELRQVDRHAHHHLMTRIHNHHALSHKTLYYVKEYGPHSHVVANIIRESVPILILSALISTLGGIAVEQVKLVFTSLIPFLILLPTLNDMIGDFGTVVASQFSTMLYEGKVHNKWWKGHEIHTLFVQIVTTAFLMSILASVIALVISVIGGFDVNLLFAVKMLMTVLIDVMFLVVVIFLIAVYAGLHVFNKKEDPNNILIPVTTSIADFGNMVILTLLISWLF